MAMVGCRLMFCAVFSSQLLFTVNGIQPCHETNYCAKQEYVPCVASQQDLESFSLVGHIGIIERFHDESVTLTCEARKRDKVTNMKLWWCNATNLECVCPSTGPYRYRPPLVTKKHYLALEETTGQHSMSSIEVANLTLDERHMFVCLVLIGGGGFADASANVTVIMGDPVVPEIIQSTERSYRTSEGNTSRLVCKATGFPTPNLHWIKDDKPLAFNSSNPRVHLDANDWLVIEKANKGDEGTYQCNATNRVGFDLSEPIELQVMSIPPDRTRNPWLLIVVISAAVIAGLLLVLVILCAVYKYRAAKAKEAAANAIDVTSPIHVDGNFVVKTGDNARINIGNVTMGSGEDLADQFAREQEQPGQAAMEEGRAMINGSANGHVRVSPSNQPCSVFLTFHPEDSDLAYEMRERLLKSRKRLKVTMQTDQQTHKNNHEFVESVKRATKVVALISSPYLKSKKHVKILQRALDALSEDGDPVHENRYIAVYFVPLERVPEELQSVVSLDYNVESDSVYFWKKFPKTVLPAGEVFL